MRIISSFKDYYDNVKGLYDEKLVWVRETHELPFEGERVIYAKDVKNIKDACGRVATRYIKNFFSNSKDWTSVYSYLVIICGEVFFAKVYSKMGDTGAYAAISGEEIKTEYQPLKRRKRNKKEWTHYRADAWNACVEMIENFDWHKLHEECKSPLLKISNGEIEVNPNLQDLGFAAVITPWDAACKFNMYFSTYLTKLNEKPMLDISNNDKIKSHGFDLKESFRKKKK